MKYVCSLLLMVAFVGHAGAQGFWFGAKGGLTMGQQNWNGYNRDMLFRGHVDLFLESNYEGSNGAFYSSLGYHPRGSAIRIPNFVNNQGQLLSPPVTEFVFHNAVLGLGFKQWLDINASVDAYYTLGGRLEYTFDNNFDDLDAGNVFVPSLPTPEFIRTFNYGFSAGGGIQYRISELVGLFFEASIHPDVSLQYDQPFPIENVINPINPGGPPITIRPQEVRNFSIELSVGMRFLRKVVYID